MRTLAERIDWIRRNSGPKKISIAEVARRGGMTRQGLSRLERESRNKPEKSLGRIDTMKSLARGNAVDLVWLQTGEGAPRKGRLTPLDVVLAEREWSDAARAAAMAEKGEHTAEQWRELLTAIEAARAAVASRGRARRSRAS